MENGTADPTPTQPPGPLQRPASLRSLLVALALFAGIVAFVSACGTDDLVFPGMNAPTSPPANTATPEP